ncbi:MAG: hypothetical protein ACXW3E_01780 [Thermoanaerobaculia bacterium]
MALSLLWTATLYAVDFAMHPRPIAAVMSPPVAEVLGPGNTPRVSLWFSHLCCSGCLNDLRSALVGLPWVGVVHLAEGNLPERSAADAGLLRPQGFTNRLDIEVGRLDAVDFVALESAVRRAGFAIERMEIGGLQHYGVEADLPHFCCRLCSVAATEQTEIVKTLRASGRFKWLDSVVINKPKKRLIVYAHYGQSANITELEEALDHLGFAPSSLRLFVETPGQPMRTN